MKSGPVAAPTVTPKLGYIDALRGYAVLLVIACHSFLSFSGLPWPARRVASLGWHGVQLFFMASALTLVMSWHRRAETNKLAKFFIRRFFRIWPMYFLMFGFYLIYTPPGSHFSFAELLTTLSFTNGWTPFTMPTTPDGWSPVPGNWSIAAEFGFYVALPWLADFLLSRLLYSAIFLVFTILMAVYYNSIFQYFWGTTNNVTSTTQFLYYWLPNQMPVFMLGAVTYHVLAKYRKAAMNYCGLSILVSLIGVAGFVALGFIPWHEVMAVGHWGVPTHWLASLCFGLLIFGVSMDGGILNNRLARSMGRVSFSAYLVHFAVIHWFSFKWRAILHLNSTGVECLVYSGLFFVLVVLTTYAISLVTYRRIEEQGIAVGNFLCDFL